MSGSEFEMAQAAAVDLPGTSGNYASTPDSPAVSLAGSTGVRLSGTATGNDYASTPDSAAVSITGDIDIRAKWTLDNWANGARQTFASKYYTGGQRSWYVTVESTGTLRMHMSADGSTATSASASSVAVPFVAGGMGWMRWTWRQSDGRVQYFTSTDYDPATQTGTWTQLGVDRILVIASIFDGTDQIRLGQRATNEYIAGTLLYTEIRNGIGGTIVAKFDPSTISPTVDQTPTTLVSSTGETWTMNGTRWNWRRDNEVRTLRLSGATGVYASAPDSPAVSLAGPTVLRLNSEGISGTYASTPDSAALSITGDIDIRVKVHLDQWVSNDAKTGRPLISKGTSVAAAGGWWLRTQGTTGIANNFILFGFTDGTTVYSLSSGVDAFDARTTPIWIRATRVQSTGFTELWRSEDGIAWTSIISGVVAAGVAMLDNASPVVLGAYAAGTTALAGSYHYAEIRNGVAGTVVAKYDPSTLTPTSDQVPTTLTATTGEIWTMTGTLWNWRRDNEVRSLRLTGVSGVNASTPDSAALSLSGTAYGLRLTGRSGTYASAPDSAALSITGDIDIRVKVAPDNWALGTRQYLLSKQGASGQRSFTFMLQTTGSLRYYWYADGTNVVATVTSTVITGYAAGVAKYVRVTHDVDNGAAGNDVKFYTSDDGVTWTQLGTTVTTAGVTSIFDSTTNISLGRDYLGATTERLVGTIHSAEIRSGIDGTIVASPNFAASPWVVGDLAAAARADTQGNTWTLYGDAGVRYDSERRSLRLTGVSGVNASAPDAAALGIVGDIDIRVKVAMDDWTPAANSSLIGKYTGGGGTRSWLFQVTTAGALLYYWSTDGATNISKTSTANLSTLMAGQTKYVRVTHDVDNGAAGNDVKFYTSDDGVTWGQLGTTVTTAGVTSIFDGTATVNMGAYAGSGGDPLAGNIFKAEIRSGIDGTIVANPNFEDEPWAVGETSGATGTDTAAVANTWTLNGAAIIQRAYNSDIDIRVLVTMDDWTPAASQEFVSKWVNGSPGNESFRFQMSSSPRLRFMIASNGFTTTVIEATVATGFADGSSHWVRVTHDVDNGAWGNDTKFYTSEDGGTWVQLGATVTTPGTTLLYDSTQPVRIGTQSNGTTDPFAGNVQKVEIRNGIDGVNVADPDFRYAPWDVGDTGAATGTDAAGNTWTLNGAAIIQRAFAADLDIRVKVALDDWTPATEMAFVSKWTGYIFYVGTDGTLRLYISIRGSDSQSVFSTVANTIPNGATKWVRVTRRVSDGRVQFFTSDDGIIWTQLGADVVLSLGGGIIDSTVVLEVGSYAYGVTMPLAGNIYYAEIRNNILNDGTGIVANPSFENQPWDVGDTSGATGTDTAAVANTWTLNGAAIIQRAFAPAGLDLRIHLALDDYTYTATQSLITKYGLTGDISWRWYYQTDNRMRFLYSIDGTNILSFAAPAVTPTTVDGEDIWLRVTVVGGAAPVANFYYSADGVTWTLITTTAALTTPLVFYDSTVDLRIGARSTGTTEPMAGNVYYAEIRNGINGPVVAYFDPTEVAIIGTRNPSVVTMSGTTWTVNGSAWDWIPVGVPEEECPYWVIDYGGVLMCVGTAGNPFDPATSNVEDGLCIVWC